MRKPLLEIIWDLGKCPKQKTYESESAGALPDVRNHFRLPAQAVSSQEIIFGAQAQAQLKT